MKLTKPIIAGTLMAMAGILHAEDTQQMHLRINFTNGTTAYINLEDGYDADNNQPGINLTPTSLTVFWPVTETNPEPSTYSYEVTGIDNFCFELAATTGISDVNADSTPVITAEGGGIVSVSCATPSEVYVYDINGRIANAGKSLRGDNTTVVSLKGLVPGVYVISCKSSTIKITKE